MSSPAARLPEERSDARSALRLEVLPDWESAAPLAAEWDRLAHELDGDVYLSPAWCRVWWRHYGRGSLQILAFRQEDNATKPGALVGVLPMFVSQIGFGPFIVRTAKFVGADSTIVVLSPAIRPEFAEAIYSLALKYLLEIMHCDAVKLGPLAGDVDHCTPIERACFGADAPGQILRVRKIGVHSAFPLPATFEDYLQSLPKTTRSNLRRNLNGLTKNMGFQSEAITDPNALREHFRAFVQMHTEQWIADGRLGHFGDWPGSLEFSEDLVKDLAPRGQVSLVCLTASGRPISYYWNFTYGRRAFWRLPARESGKEWDKYGLGRVGLVMMIKEMIAAGLKSVEGGPGHYGYKVQHGAVEHPLRSILVARRSTYSRIAARLAATAADTLHLAYYRLWRGKIVPRCGLPQRPLWRAWIRSRP